MAAPNEPRDNPAPATLAASGLPRRVRRILERAMALYSEELERGVASAVSDFEEELFRLADRGSTHGSAVDYMQVLRVVRLNRHDVVPRFMQLLESGLARLRQPLGAGSTLRGSAPPPSGPVSFRNLRLVDESVMDEGAVLHEIAVRQESRANLVLHLLGQRFGVLAGLPAFDAERNPLGPQALCRAMRSAIEGLQLEHEPRLLFYRIFDRRVMGLSHGLCEKLDALLAEEGVLPGLTYVPMRTRAQADSQEEPLPGRSGPWSPAAPADAATPSGVVAPGHGAAGAPGAAGSTSAAGQAAGAGTSPGRAGSTLAGGAGGPAQGASGGTGGVGQGGYLPTSPHTGWMGQTVPIPATADEQVAFEDLQHLLAGRRAQQPRRPQSGAELPLPTGDVVRSLTRMDAEPTSAGGPPMTIADVRQALLAQGRQLHGKPVALSTADADTFDLVELLYDQLAREVRQEAPAAALVRRMQLTLLRVALNDRAFFVRPSHPARQLLGTISDAAAKWLAEDDFDPQMLGPLQDAVTHVVKHYDGNVAVFEESIERLRGHIDQQVRRAETLERRHVEAARGKEKMEVAKQRAGEVLESLIGERPLPKFTRALLGQAWADVLTLTYLRHGEGSEVWNRQVEVTRQVVAACSDRDTAPDDALKVHVEHALRQVGYHDDEADVIARRLSSSAPDDDDDAASRTELTMKLKARVRLGEDAQKARKPDLPPRNEREQDCYETLRLLPFGTWIEFVTNQQGDAVRRRMSWFSPVTGNALFVNQRGQRIGEHSLDSLARMMAKDQVRVVTVQRAGLVDRAWNAAVSALRSLTGRREEAPMDDDGDTLPPLHDFSLHQEGDEPSGHPRGEA